MSNLNGVTKAGGVFLLWAATAVALPAQTVPVTSGAPVFTTLYNFCSQSGCTDGAEPGGPLVQIPNGNLYGITGEGGTGNTGIVFQLTPAGSLSSIYNFCTTRPPGYESNALTLSTDGSLYSTTSNGGAYGWGAAFKITLAGKITVLLSFQETMDGILPSQLVQSIDGNFYGTMLRAGPMNCGSVFKMTPAGVLTTLYNFQGPDGCLPDGLIQGSGGNFYSVTIQGGANDSCFDGCGTVFKLTPNGTLTTLYNFCPQSMCPDGYSPNGGLVQGIDGALYGTTEYGGSYTYCPPDFEGCGVVFKITPGGAFTALHAFCSQSGCPDGSRPFAGLALGTDGNLYGVTGNGGNNRCYDDDGCGTIFRISPGGDLTTLHELDPGEGNFPVAPLVQYTDGAFYGTAVQGGTGNSCPSGCGTVFSISVGLRPFVETYPRAGKVGAAVGILGTDLTGATDVKFNGAATAFRLVSSTFIEAKVPSGATSGTVTVQLPTGPLSSNVPFIVLP